MKKFEFNLEKLWVFKSQKLESEMVILGSLYDRLGEEEEKLQALQAESERLESEYRESLNENTTSAVCRMYFIYTKHLDDQMKACELEIRSIRSKIDEQIETVKKIKIETKSLETIRDTQLENYRREITKISELQLDEFVSTSAIIRSSI